MTSRERVLAALNFQPVDRVPRDLGGMRSTGVSAFSYQALRAALHLPVKPTRVHDTMQMLALPHVDVLDALGCDVVIVEGDGLTNAYEPSGEWHAYSFNGRIPGAQVRNPADYRTLADGTITQGENTRMPRGAFVFNDEHAGQPLILDGDLPRPELREVRAPGAREHRPRRVLLGPAEHGALHPRLRRPRGVPRAVPGGPGLRARAA